MSEDERYSKIRRALAEVLPMGMPYVLLIDDTALSEQISDGDHEQWSCRVETIEPKGQSYLTTRGLLEYGRDIRRQNYVQIDDEEES